MAVKWQLMILHFVRTFRNHLTHSEGIIFTEREWTHDATTVNSSRALSSSHLFVLSHFDLFRIHVLFVYV